MGSALFLLSALILAQPTVSAASALGDLEQAAGRSVSSVYVPPVNGSSVHEDTGGSGSWILHCDCSTCPRGFYPDPHPTKGPYPSEAACQQDLQSIKNRPGAGACERYYCQGSGGEGVSGGGAGAVESKTKSAVDAAKALALKNQAADRGHDLLAKDEGEDNGARFGVGRSSPGFGKLGDGPLQVLLLKLEPWCGRKAPSEGGAAARQKAREDAGKLADLVAKARARLDEADAPFQQRQRVLRLIDCAEGLHAGLLAFAEPRPKAAPTERPTATEEGLGSTPQLLREPEKVGHPYVDCASYKRVAKQLRSGLHIQQDAIAKTEAMLGTARAGAAEANEKGREQATDFAKDTVKTAAGEYLGSIHALDKGLSKTLQKTGLSREKRKLVFELKDQLEKTQERAETMGEAAEHWDHFEKAGGVGNYMQGTVNGLQASYSAAMHDPELREELLGYAGENLAALGGPASAFAFKAVKADIDLTALAISQGLDEKEAAQHLEALKVMKDQLSKNEESIRFLEEEGEAQCH